MQSTAALYKSPDSIAVLCIVCQPASAASERLLEHLQLERVLPSLAGPVLSNCVAHLLQVKAVVSGQ